MMLQTSPLAYLVHRLIATFTRNVAPARVTLSLSAQDCHVHRRRESSYGLIQQDARLQLNLSFQIRLEPGWLWSTLTLVDRSTPRSAPIVVPLLPKRQALRWFFIIQLYQLNVAKQMRLLRKSPWKPAERQQWELKRRELFIRAKLPAKLIDADPILSRLWASDLTQTPYEETIEREKRANFGAVSEQEARPNSTTRKNRNPLLEDA